MKAKYLIQLSTKNADMGATGWFTIQGTQTKAKALEHLEDIKATQDYTAGVREDYVPKQVRVISADAFKAEIRAWNRAAFTASKATA